MDWECVGSHLHANPFYTPNMNLTLEILERTQRNFFTDDRYEVRYATHIQVGSPSVLIGCTLLTFLQQWMDQEQEKYSDRPVSKFYVQAVVDTDQQHKEVFLPIECTDRILSDGSSVVLEQTLLRRTTSVSLIRPKVVVIFDTPV